MKNTVFILLMLLRIEYAKPSYSFEADIQPAIFSVTLVMMHDVVDPPLASRYYSYCTLGADAIVSKFNKDVADPSSYIKSFPVINVKEDKRTYNYQVAALYCIYETGKALLPSGYRLQEEETKYVEKLIRGESVNSSITVERLVSEGF